MQIYWNMLKNCRRFKTHFKGENKNWRFLPLECILQSYQSNDPFFKKILWQAESPFYPQLRQYVSIHCYIYISRLNENFHRKEKYKTLRRASVLLLVINRVDYKSASAPISVVPVTRVVQETIIKLKGTPRKSHHRKQSWFINQPLESSLRRDPLLHI